jgi:hypothetical protein
MHIFIMFMISITIALGPLQLVANDWSWGVRAKLHYITSTHKQTSL